MNQQQLLLTQLLGSKELTFGCLFKISTDEQIFSYLSESINETSALSPLYGRSIQIRNSFEKEIIGHPATLTDFHKWLIVKSISFKNSETAIIFYKKVKLFSDSKAYKIKVEVEREEFLTGFQYDSSKDLLDQSTETLEKIIEVITNTK